MKGLEKLSSIAEVISGYAFKGDWFGLGKEKVIRISDLVNQKIDIEGATTFDASKNRVPNKFQVIEGDILIALSGATTGKIAIATKNDEGVYVNQRVAIVRGFSEINKAYLPFILQSKYFKKILDKAGGAAQPNLSPKLIEDLEIPIPDDKEQKVIAAQLKAQLAEVEKAKQAAATAMEDVKFLKHLTLANFFETLKNITHHAIGSKADTTSGSTPSRSVKKYWDAGTIPWVKTGEIAFNDITSAEEYVTEAALKECSIKLLPINSVLIAMIGQGKTRGQSAILRVSATINQNCFAIYPNDTWLPEFMQYWLMYSYNSLRGVSDKRGGSQASLNGEMLKKVEVPAPSIDEQKELIIKIKTALTEIEVMQLGWQTTFNNLKALPNKILQQVFNNTNNE